ncbi:MAG: hypothetical protein AUG44_25810 [Actinobacteria bacterium 13_1_20CM_3_71_11]|nr:MAG: hypothetical protein AUG44_25810 [Actinobacteria bacterium 13_1_20CM_3_71_11]
MTEAHDQRLTLHLVTHVPAHEPREDDPHYHLFEQVKARMKRQGLWTCVINDDYCGGNVELHHAHIEYSQTNSTDLEKVNEALGLHLTSDEDFQKWIESPGNLEPLCEVHHRTHFGIHVIPGPLWEPLRFRKYNAKPAAEFVPASEAGEDTDDSTVKTRTTKTTTVRTHATKAGVETDTAVDEKTDTKVKAAHHTVAEHVEEHHSQDKRTAPRPRRSPEKKGFFARMFGN